MCCTCNAILGSYKCLATASECMGHVPRRRSNDLKNVGIRDETMASLLPDELVRWRAIRRSGIVFYRLWPYIMATTAVPPSFSVVFAACSVCALLLRAFNARGWLVGRGGRLGFLAQLACTCTFLGTRLAGVGDAPAAGASLLFLDPYCAALATALPAVVGGSVVGVAGTRAWQGIFRGRSRLDNLVTATSGAGGLAFLLPCRRVCVGQLWPAHSSR